MCFRIFENDQEFAICKCIQRGGKRICHPTGHYKFPIKKK